MIKNKIQIKDKRVCYVSNNFEIHDTRFLQKFSEFGMDVHAISLKSDKIDDKEKISGIKYYEYHDYFSNHHILKKLPALWFMVAYVYLRFTVNKINPDIIHSGYVPIVGFLSALLKNKPLVVMPWGSDILIDPKTSYIKKIMVQFALKRSDVICCDCQIVKKTIMSLINIHPKKIVVFPWGIDLNKFRPKEQLEINNKEIFTVISTRKFDEIYGVDRLVSAIPEIVKRNPKIKFKIMGGGNKENSFRKFVEDNNLSEFVEISSFVSNTELLKHLRSSDIYITTSYSDGTSLSLLEAMAVGLPIIATGIPANREWIVDNANGFFINPKNPSVSVEEIIINSSKNPDKLRLMGKLNFQIAQKKANWDYNFNKLLLTYETILKHEK